MSAFPDTKATMLTEKIMARIKPHLIPDEPLKAHHYNRVYEAVWEILTEALVEVKP